MTVWFTVQLDDSPGSLARVATALAERGVGKGELVQVSERVYGFDFAHADTKRSFFLALQDDWYRDLASRKVTI